VRVDIVKRFHSRRGRARRSKAALGKG
jgi:hypothetical protein